MDAGDYVKIDSTVIPSDALYLVIIEDYDINYVYLHDDGSSDKNSTTKRIPTKVKTAYYGQTMYWCTDSTCVPEIPVWPPRSLSGNFHIDYTHTKCSTHTVFKDTRTRHWDTANGSSNDELLVEGIVNVKFWPDDE